MAEAPDAGKSATQVIAARIKDRMDLLKINQKQLSTAAGVEQGTVSKWLDAIHAPSGKRLPLVAKALQTTTDYLTGVTDDPAPGDDLSDSDKRVEFLLQVADALMVGKSGPAALNIAAGRPVRLTAEERQSLAEVSAGLRQGVVERAGDLGWDLLDIDQKRAILREIDGVVQSQKERVPR